MVRASSRCGLGALVIGLLCFWSQRGAAQDGTSSLDLRYDAPAECPARSDVVRAIHDRAPRGFLAADDRSFHVHIERTDDAYRGRLQIERGGRVLSVREIRDATCEVVTTAVAVFVAIALDPAEASSSEPPSPDVPSPSPAPEQPSAAVNGKQNKPARPVPRAPAAATAERPMAGWYWGAGLGVSSVFHPSAALGARVHAEITRFAPGALLAPELRLSWGWTQLTETPPRGGEAQFRFQTARVEACALFQRAAISLAPCAGFEAGLLSATTRDLPRAGGTTEPWYAPMAAIRAGWFLVEWLSLEGDLGILLPLTRASFVIAEPERTVYRIPGGAFTATVGFRIWAELP